MKKLAIIVVAAILVYGYVQERGIPIPGLYGSGHGSDSTLQVAYDDRQSGLQVQGQGIVTRILADDVEGSSHQRFIIKLGSGQTLLLAHNIDLAPRINGLRIGDAVEFYGEYEWNPRGGVIHWTHHDPDGRHITGWIRHDGRIYQ